MGQSREGEGHGRGILVVDDFADTRDLLAEVLAVQGYQPIVAASAAEALERMRVVLPDLLITDFMMPDMTGLDLLKAMLDRPKLHDVPSIVVSARDPDDVRRELTASGIYPRAVLRKPLRLESFLATVTDALDGDGEEPSGHS